MAWDEAQRLAFLKQELSGRRPLMPPSLAMPPDAHEVVKTIR